MNNTAIIIPCYNEAHRLNPHIYCEFLREHQNVSLFFVNDGSTDGTQLKLESVARELTNAETLKLSTNQGKNVAVRKGFLRAFKRDFQYIGYWDADLSTPLSDIVEFRREMDKCQYEVMFGSRVKMLGLDIQREGIRHYAGRLGATLISMVLSLPVYDTQCGAKLFRNTPALQNVFSQPFTTNWLFDVEIIARFIVLSSCGDCQPFTTIAVEKSLATWRHAAGSKINASSFALSLFDLIRIHKFLKSHRARKRFLSTVKRRAFRRYYPNGKYNAYLEESSRFHVNNISLGGIYLETPRQLPLLTHSKVRIVANNNEIMLRGVVVWSSETEPETKDNTHSSYYGSGLKFIEMDAGSRSLLEKCICNPPH